MIPFSVESIKVARGGPLVDQLEVLFKTFQKNPLEMTKSIVPIVTKVKPTASEVEFDFDAYKNDVQEVMNEHLKLTLNKL